MIGSSSSMSSSPPRTGSSYGWAPQGLQGLYEVPVHVLTKEFHGLGLRAFFHPSLPKIFAKLTALWFQLRPRMMLVGGL